MPDRDKDAGIAREVATENLTESPAETRSRYGLSQLAEMLDAPAERVRTWLADGGVHPISRDAPDDYGIDAIEYVRTRRHQF